MPSLPTIVVTDQKLDRDELARLVRDGLGDMVKLVVDVRRRRDLVREVATAMLGTGEPL